MKFSMTLILAIASSVAFGSGCALKCKKARNEIIKPSEQVATYLNTNPTGQALAESGCNMILAAFDKIPEGANEIRTLASERFTSTTSHCARWETSTRYRCTQSGYHGPHNPPHHNPHNPPHYSPSPYPHCYPETHVFCARWRYDVNHEPGYQIALELSRDLDLMYNKASQMCGLAAQGDYDGAYRASRDLLKFMISDVKPDGDRVYALACGR